MSLRAISTAFVSVLMLGCGTTKPEVDALAATWKTKIAAEIPVGTEVLVARQWFEKQGLQPHSKLLEKSSDLEVMLGSVAAREWYCEKWMVRVVVKVTPEAKVAAYDFRALGVCL